MKRIILGVIPSLILILLLSSLSFITIGIEEEVTSTIIYVDDDGAADYTRIQDAIDNASDGDTIFVYSGTFYENLVINKSINLVGENKQSTIIDGGNKKDHNVIAIKTNDVYICNFTIQNSGSSIIDSGIYIYEQCNRNIISDNFIVNNSNGILLRSSNENKIINNSITNNIWDGIRLTFGWDEDSNIINSMSNIICRNIISFSEDGITSSWSSGNNIFENTIFNNSRHGMILDLGYKNHIYKNHIYMNGAYGIYVLGDKTLWVRNYIIEQNNISYNHYNGIYCRGRGCNIKILNNNIFRNGGPGIEIFLMYSCKIFSNNIVDNNPNARFINLWFSIWFNNYWDDWDGIKPYVISGFLFATPWSNFDWYPARKPF